jgi:hypothetical protein
MTPWALVAGALVLAACGGADDLDYDGVAGRPIPASFAGWVPSIDATADGVAATLLLDSGAGLTLLDNDHFTSLADGAHEVDVEAGELHFPDLPVLAFDVINYTQSRQPPLDGLIGGDVLGAFTSSFDYAGQRVWLEDEESEVPSGVDANAVEDAIEVEAAIEGGGLIGIPGATREVGATRFLVEVAIEDQTEPVWALIDTGASSVVLANRVVDLLSAEGRPRLDGVSVGTAAGAQTAYFTRVGSLRLGAGQLDSVPVLVLPDDSIFDALSQETGREVAAVVGGSYLRWFLATLDYPSSRLVLRRYRDPSHIDPDEFVGVGFEIGPSTDQWRVATVYPDTDAAAEGLQVGDVVRALDGIDIAGLSSSDIDALVAGFELGDELPVLFERGGTMTDVLVRVEDLLPDFVSP